MAALMARVVQALTQGGRRVLCRCRWEKKERTARVCGEDDENGPPPPTSNAEQEARVRRRRTRPTTAAHAPSLPPSLPAEDARRGAPRGRAARRPFSFALAGVGGPYPPKRRRPKRGRGGNKVMKCDCSLLQCGKMRGMIYEGCCAHTNHACE